jgi:hypothetical protein
LKVPDKLELQTLQASIREIHEELEKLSRGNLDLNLGRKVTGAIDATEGSDYVTLSQLQRMLGPVGGNNSGWVRDGNFVSNEGLMTKIGVATPAPRNDSEMTVEGILAMQQALFPGITDPATSDAGTGRLFFDSTLLALMGRMSGGAPFQVGGLLHYDVTAVGNVGAGEDDLMTWTLPGGTLSPGKILYMISGGNFANNANAKRIRHRFAGTMVSSSSSSTNFQLKDWLIVSFVFAVGVADQRALSFQLVTDLAGAITIHAQDTATADMTADIIVKATGEGVATNDVIQRRLIVGLLG